MYEMNSKKALTMLVQNYGILMTGEVHLILKDLDRLDDLEKENYSLTKELKKQDKELVELTEVLKIIVEKQVDIPELLRADNVVEYNSKHWSESLDLSKTEFNLLKGHLK